MSPAINPISVSSDSWLTEMLGKKAFRITPDKAFLEELRSGLRLEKIVEPPAFLFTKLPVTEVSSIALLEEAGFRLIDTNLLFSKSTGTPLHLSPPAQIRLASPGDEKESVVLARNNFSFSRFHLDPEVGLETAHQLKSEWVRSYFCGKRGDAFIVAEVENKIVGFLQLLKGSDSTLTIDLISVSREFRGRGIAASMIHFAEKSFPEYIKIQAGTQLANAPSLKLYQSLGFKLISSQYIFHCHLKGRL